MYFFFKLLKNFFIQENKKFEEKNIFSLENMLQYPLKTTFSCCFKTGKIFLNKPFHVLILIIFLQFSHIS
jgi:hypothetical protein